MKITHVLRLVVASSLAAWILFASGSPPKTALLLGLLAGLASVLLHRQISLLARWASNLVFTVGTTLVLLIARAGRRAEFRTGWVKSTTSSAVSNASFRRSDLSLAPRSLRRFAALALILLVGVDLLSGAAWPVGTAITGLERLESTPGVVPGDIEYAVQRDGEHFYLKADGAGEWTQPFFSSATTNWDPVKGRRTPASVPGSPLSIAVVGGSAAFGLGQQDSDTVPNQIASSLALSGVPASVSNLGVIAWTTHQAALDLRARFERGEKYDIVVAYTGFNDLVLGMNGRRVPANLFTDSLKPDRSFLSRWADHSALARVLGREPVRQKPIVWRVLTDDFDGTWRSGTRDWKWGSNDDIIHNLNTGYAELRDVTSEYGAALIWAQQPNWFEAGVVKSQEGYGGFDSFERELIGDWWGSATEEFFSNKPDTTILDLRHVLDGRPCWIDFSHTRGKCSTAVASHVASRIKSVSGVASS